MTQRLIVASRECVSFLSKFGLKFYFFWLKCRQPVVHELGEWSEYILRFTKIVGNRRMQRYTSCILQNRPNEGCKSKTAAIRILPFETSFNRALWHCILNMQTYWCVLPFEKHPYVCFYLPCFDGSVKPNFFVLMIGWIYSMPARYWSIYLLPSAGMKTTGKQSQNPEKIGHK